MGAADTAVAADQKQALAHRAEDVADLALRLAGGARGAARAPGEIQHGDQQQRGQRGATEQQRAQRLAVAHHAFTQQRGKPGQLICQGVGVGRLRGEDLVGDALELGAGPGERRAGGAVGVEVGGLRVAEPLEPGVQRPPVVLRLLEQRNGVGARTGFLDGHGELGVGLVAAVAADCQGAQGVPHIGPRLQSALDQRQFGTHELRFRDQSRGHLQRRGSRLQTRGEAHAREQQQRQRHCTGHRHRDRQPLYAVGQGQAGHTLLHGENSNSRV